MCPSSWWQPLRRTLPLCWDHHVRRLLPPLLVVKGRDADERSGLEGVPLRKEHAGLRLLISSCDLMFSCLHTACLGDMVFMVLWGGCELAWREEISVPSELYDPLSS